jgi:phosphate transport system substrate-binding protein
VEPFGHDAIIVLTYPGNPVSNLTLDQLRRIYLGPIVNWQQLGGENRGIVPLTRERSSGIHAMFVNHLFGTSFNGNEKAFTIRASKEKILKTIKRIEGSVGYGILRLEQAQTEGVKVLRIDGQLPSDTNIQGGSYPLTRPQLLISQKQPDKIIEAWIRGFSQFAVRGTALDRRP